MATNHTHSPWRKSMLIPCWCIQIFFMILFIALLGLALGVLNSWEVDNDLDGDDNAKLTEHIAHVTTRVFVPIWITLSVVCLVLTTTEIILLARHKLKPLAFLIINIIKSAVWTALFILDIYSAVTVGGRTISFLGLTIDGILLLSFWIPLLYGSITFQRFREEHRSYKPVDHPYSNPIDTSYQSQFAKAHTTTEIHSDLKSNMGNTGRPRTSSFSHERDTRYDTYRRSSFSPEEPVMATFESRGLVTGGDGIPHVIVEHHDGEVFEMESRRDLR